MSQTIRLSRDEAKELLGKPKRNKYRAVKTVIDGINFASKAEAKRYSVLKQRERAGEIYELELQKPYVLQAPTSEVVGVYKADFAYWDATVKRNRIEDVKGKDTPLSAWKRKHVKAQYGIAVEIIR